MAAGCRFRRESRKSEVFRCLVCGHTEAEYKATYAAEITADQQRHADYSANLAAQNAQYRASQEPSFGIENDGPYRDIGRGHRE